MLHWKCYAAAKPAAVFALVLAAIFCGGCPSKPILDVSKSAFSFDASRTDRFTLMNSGSGALSWDVASKPDWITLTPSQGTLDRNSQIVTMRSDFRGLAAGTHTDAIVIDSDGGRRSISVTAIVTAPPTLAVTPRVLEFGTTETVLTMTLKNVGSGKLDWEIPDTITGISINKTTGSTLSGGEEDLLVTLNRAGVPSGPFSGDFTVYSNDGHQSVHVTALIQSISARPATLDFGVDAATLALKLHNAGIDDLHWTLETGSLPAWVSVPAMVSGTIVPGQDTTLNVAILRDALGPGLSTGAMHFNSDGGSLDVNLKAQGPVPHLLADPLSLDFKDTETALSFIVQNSGTGNLNWSVEKGIGTGANWTPADVPWLSVTPASGITAAGVKDTVIVNVDRSKVTPNATEPFTATLHITATNGEQAFVAVSQMSLPPTLRVVPVDLSFATNFAKKNMAIWNGGLGVVNWRIDTTDAPSWIAFSPVSNGIVSGSVSGPDNAMVTVTVDRTNIPPADADYRWAFNVTATDGDGNTLAPVKVTASMNVARVAAIAIDTGENASGAPNVDGAGVPFIPMGTTTNNATFFVNNLGTGLLTWSIVEPASTYPAWLKSIQPPQGSLQPMDTMPVTIAIDRAGLAYGSQSFTMHLANNDPSTPLVPVRVEIQIPKRVIIGVRPSELALGLYGISDAAEVANTGDPGSVLNFQVSSNKPWCFFYPETGSSEGTSQLTKDWQGVSVSIDRSQLDSNGATAILTITAFETDDQGRRIVLENVEPVEIKVSVEAAPLSFEAALGRTRIPSLVKFVMLMRDIGYAPIPLPEPLLKPYADNFTIFEKDMPVDVVESGKFLTSGANLRTNCVILLDYSGSMDKAARMVNDPSIANAPDPLQALYLEAAGALIDSLPPHFRIALMEFHERSQPSRMVRGVDGGPAFTSDKLVLHQRLASIAIIDHGATELLPAVTDAAQQLDFLDSGALRIPFDDTDVRALICITDGRLTTPPGKVKDASDYLMGLRVRFMGVGWGDGVLHDPLARLAAGTGGHYYPTAPESTGVIGPDGKPVTRPLITALLEWCQMKDPLIAPCDQSIGKDLRSQVVMSYVTLTEDAPVKVRIDGAFDNPNDDDSPCRPEQGIISGSFVQKDLDFLSIVGDVRLGQLSLHTTGIVGGQARVVLRAEYIPRNLALLAFNISCPEAFTVSPIPEDEGGLLGGWAFADLGGGNYSFTLPQAADPLKYGAFGDIARIDFNPAAPFTMQFHVTDPLYAADKPQGKYFVCPDSITVEAGDGLAPAFPTPYFDFPAGGDFLDFGSVGASLTFTIRNIGGSHAPTGVWLDWAETGQLTNITVTPDTGHLVTTDQVNTVTVTLDRTTAKTGLMVSTFPIEFTFGTLGQLPVTVYVPYIALIMPPVLALASTDFLQGTQTIDFGPAATEATVTITNAGQSTLNWAFSAASLPAWLTPSLARGATNMGGSSPVGITVNRTGLATGTYTAAVLVDSDGGQQTITVNMTVP